MMGADVASPGRDVAPRPGLGARAAATEALIGLASGRWRDNDRLRATVAEQSRQ